MSRRTELAALVREGVSLSESRPVRGFIAKAWAFVRRSGNVTAEDVGEAVGGTLVDIIASRTPGVAGKMARCGRKLAVRALRDCLKGLE